MGGASDGFKRDRRVAGIEQAVKLGAAGAEFASHGLFGLLLLLDSLGNLPGHLP